MAHNLIFIYYFYKFSTHKKVLDWQCQQQLDSSVLESWERAWAAVNNWSPGPCRLGLPAVRTRSNPTLYSSLFSAPESIQLNMINGTTTGWSPPSLLNGHLVFLWCLCPKNFLNTFQVIQLSSPNLLDKDGSEKPANSLGEERDTHTLCWSRDYGVFASPQLLRIYCYVLLWGERGWDFFASIGS